MRFLPALPLVSLLCLALAACGTTPQYRDTNAAVDADPLCASRPDQPNEPTGLRCERTTTVIYRSDDRDRPVDFSGRDKDDDPR